MSSPSPINHAELSAPLWWMGAGQALLAELYEQGPGLAGFGRRAPSEKDEEILHDFDQVGQDDDDASLVEVEFMRIGVLRLHAELQATPGKSQH